MVCFAGFALGRDKAPPRIWTGMGDSRMTHESHPISPPKRDRRIRITAKTDPLIAALPMTFCGLHFPAVIPPTRAERNRATADRGRIHAVGSVVAVAASAAAAEKIRPDAAESPSGSPSLKKRREKPPTILSDGSSEYPLPILVTDE